MAAGTDAHGRIAASVCELMERLQHCADRPSYASVRAAVDHGIVGLPHATQSLLASQLRMLMREVEGCGVRANGARLRAIRMLLALHVTCVCTWVCRSKLRRMDGTERGPSLEVIHLGVVFTAAGQHLRWMYLQACLLHTTHEYMSCAPCSTCTCMVTGVRPQQGYHPQKQLLTLKAYTWSAWCKCVMQTASRCFESGIPYLHERSQTMAQTTHRWPH